MDRITLEFLLQLGAATGQGMAALIVTPFDVLNELAKLHPCRLPGEQRLEPLTLLTKTFQLMHEFTRHRRMISPLHHCLK